MANNDSARVSTNGITNNGGSPPAPAHVNGTGTANGSGSDSTQDNSLPRMAQPIHTERHMRVACIGAGASGLLLAYKLQRSFDNFSLVIYDKNPKISGTWYENRYPGCACDVPAHTYTWSFEPKADWSAVYAGSDEIFAYFGAFADKYSLHKYVKLQHLVTGAKWNAAVDAWEIDVIDLTTGEAHRTQADFLINASGVLNKWAWPDIAGLQDFKGTLLHTANYDRSVDLTGKRVGLIGNGSSGIQVLPTIQPQVAKLTTFVRRATWVAPTRGFEQHFYSPEELKTFATDPAAHLAYRKQQEVAINSIFPMFLADSPVQSATFDMMTQQMQQKLQGRAEALAPSLIPTFGVGCRRITPGVGYLEALGKENVEVVYGEIERVTERGCISSTDGREHEMDVLICATGFDTSYMPAFPIIGEEGRSMKQEWVQEAKSYLGLAVAGFPNYFVITGPNSPIGNGPVLCFIEAQFDYILKLATRWQTENIRSFSPKREAVEDFIAYKDQFMKTTVWEHNCRSWYKSNSVTGKVTALWPGSTLHYLEAIAEPRYEDWVISYKGNRFSWLGNGFSQTESDPTADWSYYIRDHDDSPFIGRKKALQVVNKAGTIERDASMNTVSV